MKMDEIVLDFSGGNLLGAAAVVTGQPYDGLEVGRLVVLSDKPRTVMSSIMG